MRRSVGHTEVPRVFRAHSLQADRWFGLSDDVLLSFGQPWREASEKIRI